MEDFEKVIDKIGLICMGEHSEEGLDGFTAKNGEAFIVSDCRLCDEPVWITQRGYTSKDVTKSNEYVTKGTKAVHKDCIAYLGVAVINGMKKNLEHRGEL